MRPSEYDIAEAKRITKSPVRGWMALFGGFLIHLTLGTIYCFGNLSPYVVSYMRSVWGNSPHIRTSDMTWIQTCSVSGHALAMIPGGYLEKAIGPRLTSAVGCSILTLAVLCGAVTCGDFGEFAGTYGFMFGVGIGFAYSSPLVCGMRWFAHRKGLVSGITVAGFGLGAFIFDNVQTLYVNPLNLSPNVAPYAGSPKEKYYVATDDDYSDLLNRVPSMFGMLGCIYAGMQVIGISMLKNPTDEYMAAQLVLITSKDIEKKTSGGASNNNSEVEDTSVNRLGGSAYAESEESQALLGDKRQAPSQQSTHGDTLLAEELHSLPTPKVLRTRPFYHLWTIFLAAGQATIFFTTIYKVYGETFINSDYFLSIAGSAGSVFNALGRISWGLIADWRGIKTALRLQTFLLTALMATFCIPELLHGTGAKSAFFIWVCGIFFCIGGNYSLLPTATARMFGTEFVAPNYGALFTSQLVTSVLSAVLVSALEHRLGWIGMILVTAGITALSNVLAWTLPKPPREMSLSKHVGGDRDV